MTHISFPILSTGPLTASHIKRASFSSHNKKTAGIIGGLGPQSTGLFYEAMTQYCLKHNLPSYPRLLINSVNTWEVTQILQRKNYEELYLFLRQEIALIADRVDFVVMVCNSVHAVIDKIRTEFDVPILAIYEEVCEKIAYSSVKKVGIIGTKTTTSNNFYQRELSNYGIDYVCLPETKEKAIDSCIFEEMLHGRGEGRMRSLILEGIEYMKQQGCEGVILACTELPLFVRQEDTDMPLFMSTQILAQAVTEECFKR